MKKIVFFAVALFCLWQTPHAAANDQMDYLSIENRIQDEWVDYTYSYPQITRGESRVTEQRLNGFLREYSQSTALNARLQAFVFLPQNGLQLRLEDLFSSPDFAAVLEEKSAEWRQEQGVSSNLPTLQDFYLTQDELVLLFPSPDTLTTLSFSIPLADLSGILSESLLSSLS